MFELIPEQLSLGPLAKALSRGELPGDWHASVPANAVDWGTLARITGETHHAHWLSDLQGAFGSGDELPARLISTAAAGGVVVTTGQQPGLFGGPLYTWYKALSALALANVIERETGVPAAPVFWAATDDSDLEEASWTVAACRGGFSVLRMNASAAEGTPLSRVPFSGAELLSQQLAELSVPVNFPELLSVAARTYADSRSVGEAYVGLLRKVLVPLGISVLDASHSAVRGSADVLLRRALNHAAELAAAVRHRNEELRSHGFEPQVHEMSDLSLVFVEERGVRRRVPVAEAASIAASASVGALSPNVLLRPVVERHLMPTIAYLAGPAELAYFAQSAAVSDALSAKRPRGLPRFSATIVEENIRRILARHDVRISELRDPHESWGRLARQTLPASIRAEFGDLRSAANTAIDSVLVQMADSDLQILNAQNVAEGARAGILHRIERFERRLIAAAKRRDLQLADDIATARGSLFPMERRQERALNILPLLARHGDELLAASLAAAERHAAGLLSGRQLSDGIAADQLQAG